MNLKVGFYYVYLAILSFRASLVAQMVKNLSAMQKTWVQSLGSVPGLGRFPGEENGSPLWYSCLENHMHRGAWWATVHGVSESNQSMKAIWNKNLCRETGLPWWPSG